MSIKNLRKEIDEINRDLLTTLKKRAEKVKEIGKIKDLQGIEYYDPKREKEMLEKIVSLNDTTYSDESIARIFKEICNISVDLQSKNKLNKLLVSKPGKRVIDINGAKIGDEFSYIFGPCSVESVNQIESVAKKISSMGLKFIRAGAFKPRTSPYSFQGLGIEGLKILSEVAKKYNLQVVSEVMDTEDLQEKLKYIDLVQVGARNMQNFSLLNKLGKTKVPILLKRGISATIEEFKLAAEYLLVNGNQNVVLCERGIRTYENSTRNTLDIGGIAVLKRETNLPIIVDLSHSLGRKDILLDVAIAMKAMKVDGIMIEAHPNPEVALSDQDQQIDLDALENIYLTLNK